MKKVFTTFGLTTLVIVLTSFTTPETTTITVDNNQSELDATDRSVLVRRRLDASDRAVLVRRRLDASDGSILVRRR
jgi:hypothetical protein